MLFRLLNQVLSREFLIDGNNVIASMHDRASVNGAALRKFFPLIPNCINLPCLCHTLNSVGDKVNLTFVNKLIDLFISLCKSNYFKEEWGKRTGHKPGSRSETRWWSTYDLITETFRWNLHIFKDLISETSECGHLESARKAREILAENEIYFSYELIVYLDVFNKFRETTAFLEGNGFLMPFVYKKLDLLETILERAIEGEVLFLCVFSLFNLSLSIVQGMVWVPLPHRCFGVTPSDQMCRKS